MIVAIVVADGFAHALTADGEWRSVHEGDVCDLARAYVHAPEQWWRFSPAMITRPDIGWLSAIPSWIMQHLSGRTVNVMFTEPLGAARDDVVAALGAVTDWQANVLAPEKIDGQPFFDVTTSDKIMIERAKHRAVGTAHILAEEQEFLNLRFKLSTITGAGTEIGARARAALVDIDEDDHFFASRPDVFDPLLRGRHAERLARGREKIAAAMARSPHAMTLDETGESSFVYAHSGVLLVVDRSFGARHPTIGAEILQACIHKRPFLLLAAPKTLALMRELGLRTFPEFFDESYDEIEDDDARFDAVIDNVLAIKTQTRPQIRKKLTDNRLLFSHNSYNIHTYYRQFPTHLR